MTLAFPARDRTLKPGMPAPVGLLAGCSLPVAAACLALDDIDAHDWASYGGWGSHADGSMRRGWIQGRQRRGLVRIIDLLSVFGGGVEGGDAQGVDGGWLNLVVLPDPAGTGSTIEVRGFLDAAMYVSVRSVMRSLFVTIVRVWDPTVP